MRVLGIIPARGGSKGLPRKNLLELCGLPLIGHSIRCAGLSPEVHRSVVSTDDAEIAAVSRSLGADVPFLRPGELARDDSPTMPVLRHALAFVEDQDGVEYDAVLLLEPTSPGRIPEDIREALALLATQPSADGVIACSRPSFNPFYVGVVNENGFARPAFSPTARYTRRQDVPPFFRINGALYIWRREFIQSGDWPSGNHLLFEIPEQRAFSIDDKYEFDLAALSLANGLVSLPWLPTR